MKERTYGIILGIVNIVLLAVCGVLFLGKDKNAPEIFLSNADFVYAAETGEEVLFEGVTAMDAEDGELTGSVVIEKIVTDMEKETATITYGVADSAGNVGKATCTVAMEVPEEVRMSENGSGTGEGLKADGEVSENALQESHDSEEEEAEPEDTLEGENTGEEETAEDETTGDAEEASEEENTEDEEEASEEGTTEDEEGSETEGTEAGEADAETSENGEPEREALPTAGEAANRSQTVTSRQNPGRPSMALRTQEVTVKAGQAPAWVQVIEGLYDDKDNYETLLKSLQVKGTYEKDKAGTYNVTVTVTDADGNESNAYPMKIVVEEWQ